MLGKEGDQSHARKVVVTQRRMTGVAGNENFFFLFSGEIILSIGEMTRLQRALDADLIEVILHLQ
jgi:hypothetical protein